MKNKNMVLAFVILGLVLIIGGFYSNVGTFSFSSTGFNYCTGNVQATFNVFDSNSRIPLSGVTVTYQGQSYETNSAGQVSVLIDGTQAGYTVGFSYPLYIPYSYSDNFCSTDGTSTEALWIGLNPYTNLNVASTSNQGPITVIQLIQTTVSNTIVSTQTQTLVIPPATNTITTTVSSPTTITQIQTQLSPTTVTETATELTTVTYTSNYQVLTTVIQPGQTYTITKTSNQVTTSTITVSTGQTVTVTSSGVIYVCDSGCSKNAQFRISEISILGFIFLVGAFLVSRKQISL
jgi:hypothetical protein